MRKLVKKGVGFLLLSVLLIHQMSAGMVCYAEDAGDPMDGLVREDGFVDEEGVVEKSYGSQVTGSGYTGANYTHNSRFDGMAIHNGIDVSYYQGAIDWNAVRASGIEFAFVRVGYRNKTNGSLNMDSRADANLRGAAAAGIKVGAYFFSQALSTGEAVEEANYTLNIIRNYDVTLPVVIDYEYADGGRLAAAGLNASTKTAIVNAFGDTVAANGYTPMVYANKTMLSGDMDGGAVNYMVWLANYTNETTYTGDYTCWQYSSSGSVSGISGRVDMDYWYGDFSGILHAYTGYYNGVYYGDVFDPAEYGCLNPDVKNAYGERNFYGLLQHFVTYGMSEGRTGSYSFVPSVYMTHSDLRAAFGSDLRSYYMHYINFGKAEGRRATNYNVAQSMYRLYNPNNGEHFYTNNRGERTGLVQYGWSYEGIAWIQPSSGSPVYRLYNPYSGDHHYTMSISERDNLVGIGWNYEGIGWLSADTSGQTVYRLFNPYAYVATHHYTTNAAERDGLVQIGWVYEGPAWYGQL